MSRRLRQRIARFTLAVMLVTFLSPTLGWAMLATHDELSHRAAALPEPEVDHDHAMPEDHDHGLPSGHDHADPHSFIGHLFSHMPFSLADGFELRPAGSVAIHLPMTAERIVSGSIKPPFRPPLGFPSAS
jgi:hypothetical protein